MARRSGGGAVVAVLVAAGEGRRAGFRTPKQFLRIRGRTLLDLSLERLAAHPEVDSIVVVVPARRVPALRGLLARHAKVMAVVPGGARRQDSVERGLQAITPAKGMIVLVHDAARPMVPPDVIGSVIAAARRCGAAVPGIPPADTVKEVGRGGRVRRTLQREKLRLIQTPQAFRLEWLREAFRAAGRRREVTDDASLLEAAGRPVRVVEGSPVNLKVTTAEDVARLRGRPGDRVREGA